MIKSKDHIKYVGLTIDKKLNFIEHAQNIRAKAGEAILRTLGLVRRNLGRNDEIFKEIYIHAIEPAMLYGCEIWGARAKDTRIIKQLKAAQRIALLAIVKAYRTTPTSALQTICGTPPLEITAYARHEFARTNKTIIERN